MRAVLIAAALNIVLWGALLVLSPGSHFGRPGSYQFWWFDDVPWVVVLVSLASPALLLPAQFRRLTWLRGAVLAAGIVTLLALLPYAAFSGGGM